MIQTELEPFRPAKTEQQGPSQTPGWPARWWKRHFLEPLQRVDQEMRDYLASNQSRRGDWKVMVILVTAAVCLTLQNFGNKAGVGEAFCQWLESQFLGPASENTPIASLTSWIGLCVLNYFLLPALVIRLLFRERIRDYGTKLKGALKDVWIYGVMLAMVLPLVLLASANARFQATYPFYRLAAEEPLWPYFWRWECQYGIQFLALEFFFRGFLLHGTRHRFGAYSILVMMVPYCMIHFGKPMPEALAAIIAGIALGFMSLKTRSIWMGAASHVTVALSMDFASLWRQGFFASL
jgi:membrane protease YdiL (CAAX protease family)